MTDTLSDKEANREEFSGVTTFVVTTKMNESKQRRIVWSAYTHRQHYVVTAFI